MRQLKFRVWTGNVSSENPQFLYWSPVWGGDIRSSNRFNLDNWGSEGKVDQYIGRSDYTGVEIFEGDIVAKRKKKSSRRNVCGEIQYSDDNSCYFIGSSEGVVYFDAGDYLSVIGNKYQNPELLK